jgi:hypothetical protein
MSEPDGYSVLILGALNFRSVAGVRMYEGTAPEKDVADRRKQNRAARKSRRINRRRSG